MVVWSRPSGDRLGVAEPGVKTPHDHDPLIQTQSMSLTAGQRHVSRIGYPAASTMTTFIAPALRHQIDATVVDTPMSCAARHNGTPRHTWSNNLQRTALECG